MNADAVLTGMPRACDSRAMGNLQIKDIPTDLHDELRRRAGVRGMSLRDYVLGVLRDDVSVQLQDEWLDEMLEREPADLGGLDIAEMIRAQREERGDEILRRVGLDADAGR